MWALQLETEASVVLERAKMALKRYHTHAVIANLLQTRTQEAWLIYDLGEGREGDNVEHLTTSQCPYTELEDTLTRRIAKLHTSFLSSRKL